MKVLLVLIFFTISSIAMGKSVTKRKIADLESRVSALEKKVNSLSKTQSVSGLRVKDSKNKIQQATPERSVSSTEISREKQTEIMGQIEAFKERQAESQKLLDELMNEDF